MKTWVSTRSGRDVVSIQCDMCDEAGSAGSEIHLRQLTERAGWVQAAGYDLCGCCVNSDAGLYLLDAAGGVR